MFEDIISTFETWIRVMNYEYAKPVTTYSRRHLPPANAARLVENVLQLHRHPTCHARLTATYNNPVKSLQQFTTLSTHCSVQQPCQPSAMYNNPVNFCQVTAMHNNPINLLQFTRTLLSHCNVQQPCKVTALNSKLRGNLPINWPTLLGPFKNSVTTFFQCACIQNTSFLVQSKILFS